MPSSPLLRSTILVFSGCSRRCVLLSPRRDTVAARSFFLKAKIVTDGAPAEVVTIARRPTGGV
jgi:hypothetical protein